MSLHTKSLLVAAAAVNFTVCVLAFVAADRNILPTLAVQLVTPAVFLWAAAGVSGGIDLIAGART